LFIPCLWQASLTGNQKLIKFETKIIMKTRVIISLFLFIPALLCGQEENKYPIQLKNIPSTYSKQITDTDAKNKCMYEFVVSDKNGHRVSYAKIKIRNSKTDTLLNSDINGYASFSMKADSIHLTVFYPNYTPVLLDLPPAKTNTKCTFTLFLGMSNDSRKGFLYSKRKLTEIEISKIIDDLSNGREDNILIKNKTCSVQWDLE
jgi:hypothetical protein